MTGPLWIHLTVVRKRPLRLHRKADPAERLYCPNKPDVDNYCKVLFDLLTGLEFWSDDDQVCVIVATKYYAAKDEGPCMEIAIGQLMDSTCTT